MKILFTQIDKTLLRRKAMFQTLKTALYEAPEETKELLQVIGKIYNTGKVPRFWDLLAILAGADRGYGNGWFFTALELQKEAQNGK